MMSILAKTSNPPTSLTQYKGRILVTIKNQDQLIGLIYDINNKKIIQKLDK